jgi:hypothetical protein
MSEGSLPADESKSTAEVTPAIRKENDESAGRIDLLKAVAMPLAALILGFVFNYSLSKSQANESNMRLYTEMMGRREQADSDLRKDMFRAVLEKFMSSDPKMQGRDRLDQQILELELLAYNFHESLDIGPLFKSINKQIDKEEAQEAQKSTPDKEMRERLEDLALEVKEQQLSALTGKSADMDVDLPTVYKPQGNPMSGPLRKDTENLDGPERSICLSLDSSDPEKQYRLFKLSFPRYKVVKKEIEVSLRVSQPLSNDKCKDFSPLKTEVTTKFWVGLFAFPMIDNTRLSNEERCAVTLGDITPETLPVRLSYFPGSRASLKDKPYYDEVIKKMAGKK